MSLHFLTVLSATFSSTHHDQLVALVWCKLYEIWKTKGGCRSSRFEWPFKKYHWNTFINLHLNTIRRDGDRLFPLLTEGKVGLKEWWTCIHFLCETQVFKCMTFSITENWAHPHVVQFNGIQSCCPAPDLRVVLPLCAAIRSESWMKSPCDYLKLTTGSLTNSGEVENQKYWFWH